MSYTKQTWTPGDVITAAKLNNIENGIDAIDDNFVTPSESNVNTLLGIDKQWTKGEVIAPEQTIRGTDGTGYRALSNVNTTLLNSAEALFVEVDGESTLIYRNHHPYDTFDGIGLQITNSEIYIYIQQSSITRVCKVYKAIPNINYTYIDEYDIIIHASESLIYSYIIKLDYHSVIDKVKNKQPVKGVVLLHNALYQPMFQIYELRSIEVGNGELVLRFSHMTSFSSSYGIRAIETWTGVYYIVYSNNISVIDNIESYDAVYSGEGLSAILDQQHTNKIQKNTGGTHTFYIPSSGVSMPCIVFIMGNSSNATEDYAIAFVYNAQLVVVSKGSNINLTATGLDSSGYGIQVTQTTSRGYVVRWMSLQ